MGAVVGNDGAAARQGLLDFSHDVAWIAVLEIDHSCHQRFQGGGILGRNASDRAEGAQEQLPVVVIQQGAQRLLGRHIFPFCGNVGRGDGNGMAIGSDAVQQLGIELNIEARLKSERVDGIRQRSAVERDNRGDFINTGFIRQCCNRRSGLGLRAVAGYDCLGRLGQRIARTGRIGAGRGAGWGGDCCSDRRA